MSRPATTKLKVNAPVGAKPQLEFLPLHDLRIDEQYQRTIETAQSQALIRKIAMYWNWDLCQPLVVSRRGNHLFVIDGQHRWEAAKLRDDIEDLPCVVVSYPDAAMEAAAFVELNQQRRPLAKLDVFKAAVAAGDPESAKIVEAMAEAGLSLAPHTNWTTWKPGMVSHIGGIQAAWRKGGDQVARTAMHALAKAYPAEKLRYAGTIFPGIWFTACLGADVDALVRVLRSRSQADWAKAINQASGDCSGGRREAAQQVISAAWKAQTSAPRLSPASQPPAPRPAPSPTIASRPVATPEPDGRKWCDQCERRVTAREAMLCRDRFCKSRPRITK